MTPPKLLSHFNAELFRVVKSIISLHFLLRRTTCYRSHLSSMHTSSGVSSYELASQPSQAGETLSKSNLQCHPSYSTHRCLPRHSAKRHLKYRTDNSDSRSTCFHVNPGPSEYRDESLPWQRAALKLLSSLFAANPT